MERFCVLQFLEEYRKFPCLWKKNNPDFKNRRKRDDAEEQLLPVSGLSNIKELRQKIRSIRCTYNQEVAKIRKSMETAGSEVYQPKLLWFSSADSFLRQNFVANESESDMTMPQYYVEANLEDKEAIDESTPECRQTHTITGVTSQTSRKRSRSSTSRLQGRNKVHDSLVSALEVLKQVATRSQFFVNEFTAFGQHVASQLQCLPLEKSLKLQEEIQKLITNARLQCIQKGNLYHPTTSSSFTGDETNFLSSTYSSDGPSDSPGSDNQQANLDGYS